MSILQLGRQGIKNLVFGDTLLPQEFTVGMEQPDAEIGLWLHGSGAPMDVTHRHSSACSEPFRVCIAFPTEEWRETNGHLSLRYCERQGQKRLLGEIGLREEETLSVPGLDLKLFGVRSTANYCLPRLRLGAHYALQTYLLRRKPNTSGMKMSFLDQRAAIVSFIRPHPVSLVSVVGPAGQNIFPMNIMGNLGNGYFGFGLKDSRRAAHVVEAAGRLAVCSVPVAHSPLAFKMAVNHFKDSIDLKNLPFATIRSSAFGFPVPAFTQRVRELEVLQAHPIGSHTFFVARIVCDQRFSAEPELCVIHGFYQCWRLKGRSPELKASLLADSVNKGLRVAYSTANPPS